MTPYQGLCLWAIVGASDPAFIARLKNQQFELLAVFFTKSEAELCLKTSTFATNMKLKVAPVVMNVRAEALAEHLL